MYLFRVIEDKKKTAYFIVFTYISGYLKLRVPFRMIHMSFLRVSVSLILKTGKR
jgi:hypothetical protein